MTQTVPDANPFFDGIWALNFLNLTAGPLLFKDIGKVGRTGELRRGESGGRANNQRYR